MRGGSPGGRLALVNIVWAVAAVVIATALTVSAMLLVRRRAPEGSYFSDGDRASGVFGVLATGFSVLLGFIIFLAFTSYDEARSGAEAEATIVAQQIQTAQYFPSGTKEALSGELVCYARSVVGAEWDALDAGKLGDSINPWGVEMFRTVSTVQPGTATEQSAYDRWMDQTLDRQQARTDRVHGAEGIIPVPVWLVLFIISVVIFVYMLFFADSAEGAVTQGVLMGSVTIVIALLLMLLMFFNHPHGGGVGRLQPTAMERTLRLIDAQLDVVGIDVNAPCDERGTAR
jgi:amino acid transporter